MKAPQPAYASVVGLVALGVIQYLCVALRGSVCEFALGGVGREIALAAFWSSLKTGRTGPARARNEPQRAGPVFLGGEVVWLW